jgi:hypothetical protein
VISVLCGDSDSWRLVLSKGEDQARLVVVIWTGIAIAIATSDKRAI